MQNFPGDISASKEEKNAESVVNPLNLIESNSFLRNHDTENDIPFTEEEKSLEISFKELVEKITTYRSVLEQTYLDADHDDWHGDGVPQKFRAGAHTYHDIKTALTRFIYRVHGHEEEVAAAVIAFEKIQETLSEHRDYLKKQKI